MTKYLLIGLCGVVFSLFPLAALPSLALPGQSPTPSPTEAQLKATYAEAVRLALQDRHPAEIVTNLTAITETNTSLMWKGPAGQKKVLVVTWVGSDEFDSKVGHPPFPTRELWVTVVPELQRFCRTHPGGKPSPLRIRQLLGLPPDYHVTKFVEVWVSPNDLFRPSPDPEITDSRAELNLENTIRTRQISCDHFEWFTRNLRGMYQTPNGPGFPWTRLGYTYDWGNPQKHIGLSEFVVRRGASVEVRQVIPTDSYIQQ
ncbi:MAG: hypothetical protein HY774_04530 [Acidobacteria bacterium]|nr:hypothetical protein [Acidobacteriota bacterium]